jgi:hypothetical protein
MKSLKLFERFSKAKNRGFQSTIINWDGVTDCDINKEKVLFSQCDVIIVGDVIIYPVTI